MGTLSKYIEIALDRPRKLFYNLNAMAEYERVTGKNFLDLPREQISATLLRSVLWAGLIHEDKSLTLEQVGDMITPENMFQIQGKIVQAASANVPEPDKKGGDPDPLEAAPQVS